MQWIRSRTALLSVVLLVPFLAACPDRDTDGIPAGDAANATPPAMGEDAGAAPAALTSTAESYGQAWNASDVAAVARYYTEDAMVVVGDSTYRGRAEIQQRWIAPSLDDVDDLQPHDQRIERRGDDWVETGRYTFTATSPAGEPQSVEGTYRTTWTATPAGDWRIREQEIRPDTPPPGT